MKIGTKSILYGAHCFFIHPFFVAYAWYKLYGFPFDLRLWVAFFVHDLGYWGSPNMDGEEGEKHPYFGAQVMHYLFDGWHTTFNIWADGYTGYRRFRNEKWYRFTLYHSRFLAKQVGAQYSKLCVADKLSIAYTPARLYLPMVNWTGEIYEYMKDAESGKYSTMNITTKNKLDWYKGIQTYLRNWATEHKEIKADLWTPKIKKAINKEGVWQ